MNSIYLARNNAIISDESGLGKLHIFCDAPSWDGHKWHATRQIAEVESQIFPEIECGECFEFLPFAFLKEPGIKKILDLRK